jgi:hypothetical protein
MPPTLDFRQQKKAKGVNPAFKINQPVCFKTRPNETGKVVFVDIVTGKYRVQWDSGPLLEADEKNLAAA